MIELPLGKCRNCETPVSYFARTCPSCGAANQPNPVTTVAGLAAVILLGGGIVLGVQAVRSKGTPSSPPSAEGTPAPPPQTATESDYGWIVKAMAECEEEAKQKTDTMHFLIVPLSPTGMSLPGWSPDPISGIGDTAVLLTSSDALIGLRNQAFVLYQKPLAFAVTDPETKTVYKWKPAVGVAVLKTKEADQKSLTLGFEIPDLAKEIEWGPTINLSKGSCYWINPLIRASGRKP